VSDRIELRAMRLLGAHGANPGEQERAQPFEVDVVLRLDLSRAGESDELADTVDYGSVAALVAEVLAGPPRRLIESLAWSIAGRVLEASGAEEVEVTLRKLRPPLPFDLADAGVVVTRRA
jgi:7,8-dihydroneopterin aldolase/epimerase/oxygenase